MSDVTQRDRGDQIAWELHRRRRVAVLAVAGGVLIELSSSILTAIVKNVPNVGVLQGLGPALRGVAEPAISPGAAEVRFIDARAFGLIAGSVIQAISILFIVVALDFVAQATLYRRPQSLKAARPLLIFGGAGFALLAVAHEVINAIESHQFVSGHDYSNSAVQHALSTNTPTVVSTYLQLIVSIAFAVGVGAVALNAMRAGLFPKLLGYVGVVSAFILVLPLAPELQLLVALWMAAVGFLLFGSWPGGDPPAWESGEARPWPSAADRRIAEGGAAPPPRRGLFGGRGASTAAAAEPAVVDAPPEPSAPPHPRSNKRKRRRR